MIQESEAAKSTFVRPVTPAQIRAFLVSIDSLLDMEKLRDTTPFTEAGADSLDLFNIVMHIQQATGLEINDEDIEKVNTVQNLATYLNARMA
ncbi:MAG TPA: acyl carrier protein [Terracidiphilus sp.]|jgi:acyl carrier protein